MDEALRKMIHGDPDSAEFTAEQRKSLMKAIEDWYETIDAQGLSYLGLAAALRDVADDFG